MPSPKVAQSGSAGKNLFQIGHDYNHYLSYNISAGNWGVVAFNALVIVFLLMGIGTAAQTTYQMTRNGLIKMGMIKPEPSFCTPELAMLNMQIARQIGALTESGELSAAVIGDLHSSLLCKDLQDLQDL